MSIEAWTQFIAEFQQYLAVFNTPTRYFLYGLTIGLTILSLTFSYHISRISFELVGKIVKELFAFLKKILVELPIETLKVLTKKEEGLYMEPVAESRPVVIEA